MDVDTFFNRIIGDLIDLIKRVLTDLNSARVQTTTWIRFIKDDDRVELAFNSRMTDVHQGSDLDKIVDGMIAHMMTQIENPALLNSRFLCNNCLQGFTQELSRDQHYSYCIDNETVRWRCLERDQQ